MSQPDQLLTTVAPIGPAADLEPADADSDFLFGSKAVGQFLGMRGRQVDYLSRVGVLPTFRVGRKIAATKSGLRAWLAENAAAARSSKVTGTAISDQA